ncbi:MAG: MGMT family protein [Pseudohongiellaceae bacterium]
MENRERIWQVLHRIPRGKAVSYGQLAKLAALPGYSRFAGHVLKNLPAGSRLPWHRVVRSDGRMAFPRGSEQYQLQRSRLEAEGIKFVNGKLSLRQYGWYPEER